MLRALPTHAGWVEGDCDVYLLGLGFTQATKKEKF